MLTPSHIQAAAGKLAPKHLHITQRPNSSAILCIVYQDGDGSEEQYEVPLPADWDDRPDVFQENVIEVQHYLLVGHGFRVLRTFISRRSIKE